MGGVPVFDWQLLCWWNWIFCHRFCVFFLRMLYYLWSFLHQDIWLPQHQETKLSGFGSQVCKFEVQSDESRQNCIQIFGYSVIILVHNLLVVFRTSLSKVFSILQFDLIERIKSLRLTRALQNTNKINDRTCVTM